MTIVFSTSRRAAGNRNTMATDAAHMNGIGSQTFGTLYNVCSYDAGRNVAPLAY